MKTVLSFCVAVVLFSNTGNAQAIKGTYAIKNVQTGLLLRVKDASNRNGTPIVLYQPQNWKCMTWNFKQVDENIYQLQNLFTNKTMQATGIDSSAVLNEQPLAQATDSQLYTFELVGTNTYLIQLKGTAQYLTAADEDNPVNLTVMLAPKRGDKSQQWTIYQQSPTM